MSVEPRLISTRDIYFRKRKIPKLLSAIFLIFQAMGLDFGFASVVKRKFRLFVQRITLVVSVLSMMTMSVYLALSYNDIWCWFYTIKNNGLILVLITTKYKLYHFIYDMNGICDLTTKQIRILKVTIILFLITMYPIKLTLFSISCILDTHHYCRTFVSMFHLVVYMTIALTLDVIVVAQYNITYYLKCSVILIKELLRKHNRKLDVFEKSYTAIADCYDKIRPLYDWLVSFNPW